MIGDTIHAIGSPPGAAARGILRLSGPAAFSSAAALVGDLPRTRAATDRLLAVLGSEIEALVLTMPAPHSYTGEDVVELHLPGSPVLLDEVCARLPETRLATPGEFTRRAFENRRLDLAEAEAVQQLIHAADAEEGRFALDVLRGGMGDSLATVRAAILDGRALLEAGLDFTDGETGAVSRAQWLPSVQAAQGRITELRAALPSTRIHGDVLLLGAANAGKSALANALAGDEAALVADVPGTTRDVLAVPLSGDLRLLDGPGDLDGLDDLEAIERDVDRRALAHRDRLLETVAAVVEVIDPHAPRPPRRDHGRPVLACVFTKADLQPCTAETAEPAEPAEPAEIAEPGADGTPRFIVSSVTGAGLEALRAHLLRTAAGGTSGLGARLDAALGTAAAALQKATAPALPEELVAQELGAALAALATIDGCDTSEAVLDRIFAGFCLGK